MAYTFECFIQRDGGVKARLGDEANKVLFVPPAPHGFFSERQSVWLRLMPRKAFFKGQSIIKGVKRRLFEKLCRRTE